MPGKGNALPPIRPHTKNEPSYASLARRHKGNKSSVSSTALPDIRCSQYSLQGQVTSEKHVCRCSSAASAIGSAVQVGSANRLSPCQSSTPTPQPVSGQHPKRSLRAAGGRQKASQLAFVSRCQIGRQKQEEKKRKQKDRDDINGTDTVSLADFVVAVHDNIRDDDCMRVAADNEAYVDSEFGSSLNVASPYLGNAAVTLRLPCMESVCDEDSEASRQVSSKSFEGMHSCAMLDDCAIVGDAGMTKSLPSDNMFLRLSSQSQALCVNTLEQETILRDIESNKSSTGIEQGDASQGLMEVHNASVDLGSCAHQFDKRQTELLEQRLNLVTQQIQLLEEQDSLMIAEEELVQEGEKLQSSVNDIKNANMGALESVHSLISHRDVAHVAKPRECEIESDRTDAGHSMDMRNADGMLEWRQHLEAQAANLSAERQDIKDRWHSLRRRQLEVEQERSEMVQQRNAIIEQRYELDERLKHVDIQQEELESERCQYQGKRELLNERFQSLRAHQLELKQEQSKMADWERDCKMRQEEMEEAEDILHSKHQFLEDLRKEVERGQDHVNEQAAQILVREEELERQRFQAQEVVSKKAAVDREKDRE